MHCRVIRQEGVDKITLVYEVPVLTVSQEVFACALQTKVTDFVFYEEPRGPFALFTPDVCTMAGITDNKKAEIPTPAVFITAQSSDANCRASFTSVRKPSTRFNVNGEGV